MSPFIYSIIHLYQCNYPKRGEQDTDTDFILWIIIWYVNYLFCSNCPSSDHWELFQVVPESFRPCPSFQALSPSTSLLSVPTGCPRLSCPSSPSPPLCVLQGHSGSFQWRRIFRNQGLGAGVLAALKPHCPPSLSVDRAWQYMCVSMNPLVHTSRISSPLCMHACVCRE